MDFSFIPTVYSAGPLFDTAASYSTNDIIRVGVSLIVIVACLCSIFFIITGGLMLIVSGGKDDKVRPAINSIRYAVIGIVCIVIAIFVAPKMLEMLGLGSYEYISPKRIFQTITDLTGRIFGGDEASYMNTSIQKDPIDFSDL